MLSTVILYNFQHIVVVFVVQIVENLFILLHRQNDGHGQQSPVQVWKLFFAWFGTGIEVYQVVFELERQPKLLSKFKGVFNNLLLLTTFILLILIVFTIIQIINILEILEILEIYIFESNLSYGLQPMWKQCSSFEIVFIEVCFHDSV